MFAVAATFGIFFSHQTLIVLTPYYVAASGSGDAVTGSITGVFMFAATVTPLAMARLLSLYDTRSLLVVSVLLLAAPAFAYSLTPDPVSVAALSLVRGVGFGIAAVACAMVISVQAPPERRGAAVGWFGLAASAPAIFGPGLAFALVGAFGFVYMFLFVGLVTFLSLAAVLPLGPMPPIPAGGAGVSRALRRSALLLPSAMFAFAALVYGGLLTFVPLYLETAEVNGSSVLFFLIFGTSIAVSRALGGTLLERFGAAVVFPVSLGASIFAVLLLALVPLAGVPPLVALLFGCGFGTAATATHAVLVSRVSREGYGTVNALYNVAFNGGIGAGGALFGVVAQAGGYAFTFLSAALWLAASAALFLLDRAMSGSDE
ncbi:MFS transporter [Rubrobacter marinus]|uniref:MFS transporter n=1 Tax=Rubrobacter marinus TaxID=2653852 RepID=UPI00140AE0BF|nr:MFS transporter [Rubrobacter marinus]